MVYLSLAVPVYGTVGGSILSSVIINVLCAEALAALFAVTGDDFFCNHE